MRELQGRTTPCTIEVPDAVEDAALIVLGLTPRGLHQHTTPTEGVLGSPTPLLLQLQPQFKPRLPPTEVVADFPADITLETTEATVVEEVTTEDEETEDEETEAADTEDTDTEDAPMEEDTLDASLPLPTTIRSTATLLLLLLKPLWLPSFPKSLQFLPTPAIGQIPPRDTGLTPLRDTGPTKALESRTPPEDASTTDTPDTAGTTDPRRMTCSQNEYTIATT